MSGTENSKPGGHTQVILDYYAERGLGLHKADPNMLIDRYLSKIMTNDELSNKSVLEMGAGCSQYISVFLQNECKKYFANDLILDRLAAIRVDDPRYHEIPGDFRTIVVPEAVDIVFANLTMMYLQPMLDEFVVKIRDSLKIGGMFFSFDSNYFCPLSFYRRFAEPTPARLFSPFRYANTFRRHGFEIEKLVPFTPPLPWTKGNWLLGTNFWLRARRCR